MSKLFTVLYTATTVATDFPADTPAPGAYRASILNSDGTVAFTQDNTTPSFTFTDVPEGEYVMQVQRLGADDGDLGHFAEAFTVHSATVSIDIPNGGAITITAQA